MSYEYRVLSRNAAVALAGAFVLCAALAIVAADAALDGYSDRVLALQAASPNEARALLARGLKVFAAGQLVFLFALSVGLARYGRRAVRSGSMPPPGAWIIEGQAVRIGRQAALAGRVVIVCATLVAISSVGIALIAWRLAVTV